MVIRLGRYPSYAARVLGFTTLELQEKLGRKYLGQGLGVRNGWFLLDRQTLATMNTWHKPMPTPMPRIYSAFSPELLLLAQRHSHNIESFYNNKPGYNMHC